MNDAVSKTGQDGPMMRRDVAELLHRYAICRELVSGRRILVVGQDHERAQGVLRQWAADVVIHDGVARHQDAASGGKGSTAYDVVVALEQELDAYGVETLAGILEDLTDDGLLICTRSRAGAATQVGAVSNLLRTRFRHAVALVQSHVEGSAILPLDGSVAPSNLASLTSLQPRQSALGVVTIEERLPRPSVATRQLLIFGPHSDQVLLDQSSFLAFPASRGEDIATPGESMFVPDEGGMNLDLIGQMLAPLAGRDVEGSLQDILVALGGAAVRQAGANARLAHLERDLDHADAAVQALQGQLANVAALRDIQSERLGATEADQALLIGRIEELAAQLDRAVERIARSDHEAQTAQAQLTAAQQALREASVRGSDAPVADMGSGDAALQEAQARVAAGIGMLEALRRQISRDTRGAELRRQVHESKELVQAKLYASEPGIVTASAVPTPHLIAIKMLGLFDADWYADRYHVAPGSAWMHFMFRGAARGNDPHPLFNSRWFAEKYPHLVRRKSPLNAYLSCADRRMLDPHPLFSPSYYVSHHRSAARSRREPIAHYLRKGIANGWSPHPLVDIAWIERTWPDGPQTRFSLVAYLTDPQLFRLDPHPLFSGSFYLSQNPDVEEAGMNPLLHYLVDGWKQGRSPHPDFHNDWYLAQNPDVLESGANPLVHYVTHGGFEDRAVAPLFDQHFYRARYPDVKESNMPPLVHYLAYGKAEGRSCSRDGGASLNMHDVARREEDVLPGLLSKIDDYLDMLKGQSR